MKKALHILAALLGLLVWGTAAGASPVESALSFRRFTTLDGLPQMQTETVWQDERGYIYIGTLSGFVRFDGRSMTPFLRGQRENIVAFQETDGRVRALGFVRQWTIDGNDAAKSPIDPDGQLLLNNFNASDLPPGYILLEDRQEQGRRLCLLDATLWHPVAESPLLDEMTPDRKLFLDGADLFVPTPQGLYRLTEGQSRRLTKKADIFSLLRVPDGLLAFAADGIYEVAGDSLTLRTAHCFEDPDYGLYVRRNAKGQLLIADAHTIWLCEQDGAGPVRCLATGFNLIRGLFVDRWDRLWAATYQGAYCFFHCNFVHHRLEDRNDIVRALADGNGHLVMGTLNGKVLVDGQVISAPEDNFYAPGAARLGHRVYLAGNGDVAVVEGTELRWLGLPHDYYRFVCAAGERLVIGTRGSVLSYDPATERLDTLSSDIVHPWCAADDGEGRLWVSGNPGLYCLTDDGTGATAIRKTRNTPMTRVITSMATDGRGTVCYALADSLFCIRNGRERAMTELQPALTGHEIRSLHLTGGGHLVVAAIDGLLVSRIADGRAEGQHWFDASSGFTMIEPLMGAMAETADGTLYLAGIEGMTSFRPEDLLSDNQESTFVEEPRTEKRQRIWPWILAALLLSFTIWRVAKWFHLRQARKKMAVLEREKTQKELQLQAVRLKAIPHFHSNVLAGIEYFIMNRSADEASHYLKLYSDFTNQTLSDIDRPARSVADEVDYVCNYLELERLRYGERLQYDIRVEPDVDRNVLLPTMLLHTYCQNAVKHGIASKVEEGHVEIHIRKELRDGAEGVLVSVSDNGVGRAEAARSGGYSTGQGLKILSQQIDLYNQTNRHAITQHVTDLTDGEGRPAGTRFETWVPVDYQF